MLFRSGGTKVPPYVQVVGVPPPSHVSETLFPVHCASQVVSAVMVNVPPPTTDVPSQTHPDAKYPDFPHVPNEFTVVTVAFGKYELASVGADPVAPVPQAYVTVNGTTHCEADVDPAGDMVPNGHSLHHGLPASLNCVRVLA